MQQTIKGQRSIRWALLALLFSLVATVVAVVPAEASNHAGRADKPNDQAADAAAADDQAPDRFARGRADAAPGATKALEAIQRRIERYVDKHGTRHTFASYIDSDTGRIVLETDAPASVVDDLTRMSDAAQQRAVRNATVRRTTTSDTWHRRDDIQPYWGGAGIRVGNGLCSSGYAVQTSSGYRYSVTAGHCFADWAQVQTESGTNTYGWVIGRRLPTVTGHAMDMELMYGRSYAGRIYTGGTVSTSSAPVAAAGQAYVGYTNYCHSGRTTGENCGHTATSITGQVCTQTGCKSPVIVFNGGTQPLGGDSGSPFYAKDNQGRAWIRGHVIAGNGTTSYAERWVDVQSTYGVSIVTG
jgi:hypothetical protein